MSNEDDEAILELATECEDLFKQRISDFDDTDDLDSIKILKEYFQRFTTWAAFLGVFADPKVCLDRRLRHHVEIQDLVVRLLDTVENNLTYLFETRVASEHMDIDSSGTIPSSSKLPPKICLENLEAIAGAIERLNHLGVAIRRSSVTDQVTKARKFAGKLDTTSFERVVDIALKSLYPDASLELLEHLTRAMTETYSLFRYRQSRHERLQPERIRTKQFRSLPVVQEDQVEDAEPMVIDAPIAPRNEDTPQTVPQTVSRPPPPTISSQSRPTSVNSKEVQKRLLQKRTASRKTKSVLVNQVDYSRPSKESLICEWCFNPLSEDVLQGDKWNQHMNEDHKPYICLSEKCSEPLERFATSAAWHKHLTSMHGPDWHQEVHLPLSWICPLCTGGNDSTFTNSQGLTQHILESHPDTLTQSQTQIIVQQSSLRLRRTDDACPLCCLSIIEDNKRPTIKKSNGSQNTADLDSPMTDDHKSKNQDDATKNREEMASHVATHLRGIINLTLRLISTNSATDASEEDQSASGHTDHLTSRPVSNHESFGRDSNFSEDDTSIMEDVEHDNFEEDVLPVPESLVDWIDVPRAGEVPVQDDMFLQKLKVSGFSQPSAIVLIPYERNPRFVIRSSIAKRLEDISTTSSNMGVLLGVSGSGKTEIAIDYAYNRALDDSCSVFWVRSDCEETFVSDYEEIALKLGVDLDLPRNEMLVEVCKAIQKQPQWVLILDNANDVVLFGKKEVNMSTNLLQYIPRAVRGTVLWTTRNRAIGHTPAGFALNIIVSVMKATEAMELLSVDYAMQTIEQRFLKNTLLAELEWHTLAIYQAAAYMQTTSTGAKQYLDMLRSHSIRLGVNLTNTPDELGESDPYKGVLKTSQIAINWLAKHDKEAYRMLHVAAYFHHRNIPPQVLEERDLPDTVGDLKATPFSMMPSEITDPFIPNIANAKKRLLDFGFITQRRHSLNIGRKRYDMHELIQEAVRRGLRIDVYFKYDPGDRFLRTALLTLEDIAGYTAPERRMKENYSAHVAEVAKWSSGIGRTIETADRLTRLSNIFISAGQWAQAEPLLTSALNIQYKLLGNDNAKTVTNMADLGLAYYGQGRYGEAQSIQVRALGVSTKLFGVKHLNTIRIMMGLAKTYQNLGSQLDQAVSLARDAIELYKDVLGYTHAETVLGMELLGSIYDQQGRMHEIEALYRGLMNRQRKEFGAKDPRALAAMAKLAIVWSKIGRKDEATELMTECYKLRKVVLGPDHPETQECMDFFEDRVSQLNALVTTGDKEIREERPEGGDEDIV